MYAEPIQWLVELFGLKDVEVYVCLDEAQGMLPASSSRGWSFYTVVV